MPETAPHTVQTLLSDLYEKHVGNDEGHVATYIPAVSYTHLTLPTNREV